MKLNTLLLINAIVSLVYGIGLVVLPSMILTLYGLNSGPGEQLMARFFGVALLAFGLVTWFARNTTDPVTQRAFIQTHLVSGPIGALVAILATLNNTMNMLGWSVAAIYVFFGLGYAYFQFMKPSVT